MIKGVYEPSKFLMVKTHKWSEMHISKIHNFVISDFNLIDTSGFATTHVVISVRHPTTY